MRPSDEAVVEPVSALCLATDLALDDLAGSG